MFDNSGSPSRKLQDVSRQAHERSFHDGRVREFMPYGVGVQISCGVHPEVSPKDAVCAIEEAVGRGIPAVGDAKGESDRRGTYAELSRAYANRDSAQVRGVAGDRFH